MASKTTEPAARQSREKRRWSIFAAACVAFLLCVGGLWALLSAHDVEMPVRVFGWIALPSLMALTAWLAIKVLRTKSDDPFFTPDLSDIP